MSGFIPRALAVAILSLFAVSQSLAEEFAVASWNVENLFDTEDDPKVTLDEEFTPHAPKKWTAERLDIKLNNLAKMISKVNWNKGPDILGLCEIENRKVVEMLVEKLAPLGRKYEIVHQDSPSERGIDCALVYDANKFGLGDKKFHIIPSLKTRNIVEAELQRDGADLFVFVNHWPSRRNDESQRVTAAETLRKRLDEILAADPEADIIMLGDFNDNPDNIAIKDHLRAAASEEALKNGAVLDTTAPIAAAGKGTHVYDNKWNLLDHIIVSQGMLDETKFHWKPKSSRRMEVPALFFHPNFPGAVERPNKSYSENNFHKSGYSDHLPVECIIMQ